MKKVAVIIVNWNGKKFLGNCLKSVYEQSYDNFDLYFVDNGSIDDSVEFVKKNFPKACIISLTENTGFALGNNIGIEKALEDSDVEYVVLLNNDTVTEKDWLQSLVKLVDYENKVDMISSKSLFLDGKVQTIGLKFEKNLMGDSLGGLAIGFGQNDTDFNKVEEVFCPSGVSCLYSRRLLQEVGFFDEDFFAYAEDLDLGMRARKKGYKCLFSPDSRLIHLHSQSSGGRASKFKSFLIKRNIYFVAIKNFSTKDLLLFPFRDFAWNFKNIFSGNKNKSSYILRKKVGIFGIFLTILHAYSSVIYYLPKMLKKRWILKSI